MKKNIILLLSVVLCMFFTAAVVPYEKAAAKELEKGTPQELVYEFAEAVNNRDIDRYVSLFASEIQEEMKKYLEENGKDVFFAEDERRIEEICADNDSYAVKEKELYSDVAVFRVKEYVAYPEKAVQNSLFSGSGLQEHLYVTVKEDGKWKLYRVSASSRNQ